MVDKLLFIASSPVPGTADGLRLLGVGGSNLNLLTFVGIVNFQSQLGPPVQPAGVCLHSEYCTKETINKFRRLRELTLFHRGADERGQGPGFPSQQCWEMYYLAAHKRT